MKKEYIYGMAHVSPATTDRAGAPLWIGEAIGRVLDTLRILKSGAWLTSCYNVTGRTEFPKIEEQLRRRFSTMIPNHSQFIDAIKNRKKVWVRFYSKADDGVLEHRCAPLDYGPGEMTGDALNRYWLWDYDGGPGASTSLGLLPQQIVELQVLGGTFDPAEFVFNTPLPQAQTGGAPAGVSSPVTGGCCAKTAE